MLWVYLAIFLAVFFLPYKYVTRKFDYWKKKNVFYFKPVPFFGNMLNFLSTREPFGKNFGEICNAAGDRDFFGIFVFDQPTLVIKSPKLIKTIFNKDFSYFNDRSVSDAPKHRIMSNVLFVQKNPVWKEVRSKLSPIFSSGKLKLMFTLILEESTKMADYVSTLANIPDVETKEICAKYSTNVITKCAFGVDANSFKDDNALFRKLGREMFEFKISTALRQMAVCFAPTLASLFNIIFVDPKIVDKLEIIFAYVLHVRMASKNLKGIDFVDTLIEANRKSPDNGFSKQSMLGQAIQFFSAGFETVSSAMSFTLYELCVNSDIQEKLRNEINSVIAKHNGITYEAVNEMKYLDNCVSESLRKYSIVPFLDRICTTDYKVPGTNMVIEKGTPVYISTDALHHNPKYFPDPEKYEPERFSDKASINKDGLFYLPFGDGPRACIGLRFAILEIKLGLVSIVSRYMLQKSQKTPEPIKFVKRSLILQSTVGIPFTFLPIKI